MDRKFTLSHNRNDVMGSYKLMNEKDEVIGKSVGYSIKKRYISYSSSISNTSLMLMKRGSKKYVLFNGEEIFGIMKIYLMYNRIEIILADETIYEFRSENLGKTYRIKRNGDFIHGEIHSISWKHESVKIEFENIDPLEMDYLIAFIIGISYDIDSNPLSMFKEKPK